MLPTAPDLVTLQRRIRVAQGHEPADLVLRGGFVANVHTRRLVRANVAIVDGFIAGMGDYDWPAHATLDVSGKVIAPGFIDAHMHLESTLLAPAELARVIVPHGTTAIISDSHEIGNVLGLAGIDMLLAASTDLPLDLFLTASSCVPATALESAGAWLGPAEVRALLERPRVLALAEVMDVPAVLGGHEPMLEKLRAALHLRAPLDGHAPAMIGRDLQAYVAAGMRSDHESSTLGEARAKAALGMLVQVREGSSALNLEAILPALVRGELGDEWCLVTDDVYPDVLQRLGHLDGMLRRLVAAGLDGVDAVRHVTLIPARHYGLSDRGAVTPGYRADLVILDDLTDFGIGTVLKGGAVVVRDGQYVATPNTVPLDARNTIHLGPLDASAFRLAVSHGSAPAIRIVPDQLLTVGERTAVRVTNGDWQHDPAADTLLIASLERHTASGRVGVGLVNGFGLRRGAIASSVAHDSHNLVVAGANAGDMLVAARHLETLGGGFVVVVDGEVRAAMPLPVAGLLSLGDADTVAGQLAHAYGVCRNLGCDLTTPFGTLSFLALPVIPELRITDRGLFDVNRQALVTS